MRHYERPFLRNGPNGQQLRKKTMKKIFLTLSLMALMTVGCEPAKKQGTGGSAANTKAPVFTLAWSEYPSWSVFGVASELGLVDGLEGSQGELEKKWNVDMVLKGVDYDSCIQFYGSSEADAVCITNMDILGMAVDRPAVAILPTSTSVGADACIAVGIDSLEALKGQPTKGLERSVSQYAFERILIKRGLNPSSHRSANGRYQNQIDYGLEPIRLGHASQNADQQEAL
jgi:hypothetical protein